MASDRARDVGTLPRRIALQRFLAFLAFLASCIEDETCAAIASSQRKPPVGPKPWFATSLKYPTSRGTR